MIIFTDYFDQTYLSLIKIISKEKQVIYWQVSKNIFIIF